jgi:hypothetical protein
MSNQVLLWGTLIIPWISLLFMPKEDIKRYISAGFLSTICCIIVIETGIRYNWWAIRETTFPFAVIPTYAYGLFPVIPMWLLKYTYGRLGLYVTVDTILNIVFAFVILPWFGRLRVIDFDFNDGYIVFIFESVIALLLYGFQMWHESIYVRSERESLSPTLHPAAAKPLPKDKDDK